MGFVATAKFTPVVNTPSPGFNAAMHGFSGYGGTKESLGAAFYPMLFDGLRSSFGQAGMDPYGNSVRQLAAPTESMPPAEQYRKQMQEQEDLRKEREVWKAKWQAEQNAKHAAARPQTEAWLKTQTPDNQRLYRLMMGY